MGSSHGVTEKMAAAATPTGSFASPAAAAASPHRRATGRLSAALGLLINKLPQPRSQTGLQPAPAQSPGRQTGGILWRKGSREPLTRLERLHAVPFKLMQAGAACATWPSLCHSEGHHKQQDRGGWKGGQGCRRGAGGLMHRPPLVPVPANGHDGWRAHGRRPRAPCQSRPSCCCRRQGSGTHQATLRPRLCTGGQAAALGEAEGSAAPPPTHAVPPSFAPRFGEPRWAAHTLSCPPMPRHQARVQHACSPPSPACAHKPRGRSCTAHARRRWAVGGRWAGGGRHHQIAWCSSRMHRQRCACAYITASDRTFWLCWSADAVCRRQEGADSTAGAACPLLSAAMPGIGLAAPTSPSGIASPAACRLQHRAAMKACLAARSPSCPALAAAPAARRAARSTSLVCRAQVGRPHRGSRRVGGRALAAAAAATCCRCGEAQRQPARATPSVCAIPGRTCGRRGRCQLRAAVHAPPSLPPAPNRLARAAGRRADARGGAGRLGLHRRGGCAAAGAAPHVQGHHAHGRPAGGQGARASGGGRGGGGRHACFLARGPSGRRQSPRPRPAPRSLLARSFLPPARPSPRCSPTW